MRISEFAQSKELKLAESNTGESTPLFVKHSYDAEGEPTDEVADHKKEKFSPSLFGFYGICMFFCGFATLANFNAIIMLFKYYDNRYPADLMGTTGSFPENSQLAMTIGQTVATTILLFFPKFDIVKSLYTATAAQIGIGIIYPLITLTLPASRWSAFALLFLALLQHGVAGATLTGSFAFASVLSGALTAQVGLGVGMQGIFTSVVSTYFEGYGPFVNIWAVWGFTLVVQVASIVALALLLRRQEVSAAMQLAKRNKALVETADFETVSLKPTNKLAVLYRARHAVFSAFMNLGVLFTIYPAKCAAVRPEFTTTALGLQNVGELVGRGLISLGVSSFPPVVCSIVAVGRVGFVFVLAAMLHCSIDSFWRSASFMSIFMLLQSFTFGLVATSTFGVAADSVTTESERQLAALYTMAATNYGIPIGSLTMYAANKWTNFFNSHL